MCQEFTPRDVIDHTHLWLMRKIDGNNAAAFQVCVEAIPYGPEASIENRTSFSGTSKEYQAGWIAAFWDNQMRSVGIYIDRTLEDYHKGLALSSPEALMEHLKPTIEQYDLPRGI